MTPRHKRIVAILVILFGVGIATGLALKAFRANVLYYFTPSQVVGGEAHTGQIFRMGGLVVNGSVQRQAGSMTVRFTLTDMQRSVPVVYTGILPDLFREGQGIVVHGVLGSDGLFTADEVLAKHDQKYMPPEVATAIKKATDQAARAGAVPLSPH